MLANEGRGSPNYDSACCPASPDRRGHRSPAPSPRSKHCRGEEPGHNVKHLPARRVGADGGLLSVVVRYSLPSPEKKPPPKTIGSCWPKSTIALPEFHLACPYFVIIYKAVKVALLETLMLIVLGELFFEDTIKHLASSMFAVALLISNRSSTTRFFISETLRSPCDFSEAKSRIGVINCFFFLVRRCGDDTITTSSALAIFADLLRMKTVNKEMTSTLLKLTKSTRGIMSSALDITDLLRELRLKTVNRGLTSTLLEISTDLLRELPSRLYGMNIVFRLNKGDCFRRKYSSAE
nr:hypothetical protein Iba_chr04dCG13300 [Ipomoea batatas]